MGVLWLDKYIEHKCCFIHLIAVSTAALAPDTVWTSAVASLASLVKEGKVGPLWLTRFNLVSAWIIDFIHCKVWDEMTYPFRNFSGEIVKLRKWTNNFIPHLTGHMITYLCLDLSQCIIHLVIFVSDKTHIHISVTREISKLCLLAVFKGICSSVDAPHKVTIMPKACLCHYVNIKFPFQISFSWCCDFLNLPTNKYKFGIHMDAHIYVTGPDAHFD